MRDIFSIISAGDSWLFVRINNLHCVPLDFSMPLLTRLGGAFFTLSVCFALIVSNFNTSRTTAVEAFVALCGSQLLVQYLKRKIGRERPYSLLDSMIVKPLWDCSFPSGHTSAGYAMAVAFSLNYPVLGTPLILIATLVGFSRTYLGLHYPLDVLGGALLGGGAGYAVHLFAIFV